MAKATASREKAWPRYLEFAARPDARSLIERKMVQTENGCWRWVAAVNARGYGILHVHGTTRFPNGTTLFAHRLSYLIHREAFDPSSDVDHLCRNTLCVNPAHLEPVTHGENVRRGLSPIRTGGCSRGHDDIVQYKSGKACRTCQLEYKREKRHGIPRP